MIEGVTVSRRRRRVALAKAWKVGRYKVERTASRGISVSNPRDDDGSGCTSQKTGRWCSARPVRWSSAPAEWTPANITFLVSIDGVNFFDFADAASGLEISRAIQPSTAVKVDQSYTRYANHLKVRSGPRDHPIAQEADRVLTLATSRV